MVEKTHLWLILTNVTVPVIVPLKLALAMAKRPPVSMSASMLAHCILLGKYQNTHKFRKTWKHKGVFNEAHLYNF